jgi:hypothetical protein
LLFIKLPKTPSYYTVTPKMANEIFAETLNNCQHSTSPRPKFYSELRTIKPEDKKYNAVLGCDAV